MLLTLNRKGANFSNMLFLIIIKLKNQSNLLKLS